MSYRPPNSFTDIQVIGPYRSWEHLHVFKKTNKVSLIKNIVTYSLPLTAILLHRPLIMKQLYNIFSYRAALIDEWAHVVMVSSLKV